MVAKKMILLGFLLLSICSNMPAMMWEECPPTPHYPSNVSLSSQKNQKLLGEIDQKQFKAFLAGFCMGAAHGAANRAIQNSYKNKSEVPLLADATTYIATSSFESIYNGGRKNNSTLWGRAIGQTLVESVSFYRDGHNQVRVKIGLSFNFSLFKALSSYFD